MGFGRRAVRGVRTPGLVQPNQNLNTYIWQLNGFGSRWGIPAESFPLAVGDIPPSATLPGHGVVRELAVEFRLRKRDRVTFLGRARDGTGGSARGRRKIC